MQPKTRHSNWQPLRACGAALGLSLPGNLVYDEWLWPPCDVRSANTWTVATYKNVPAENSIAIPVNINNTRLAWTVFCDLFWY